MRNARIAHFFSTTLMSHRKPVAIGGAIMFLGMAGIGVAWAESGSDTPVYDQTLGMTVPQSYDTILQQIFQPNGTESDNPTEWTDNGSPLEFPPRVVSMDWNSGDYRPPYSYQEIQPTNAYQSADGTTELEIFVGADGEDLSNGIFIRRVTDMTGDAGFNDSNHVVTGSGAVTITGFKGDLVFWKSDSGKIGTYSLSTGQVASNQPPNCSAIEAPPPVLWPANHKLVAVTVSGAIDPDGDTVTLTIDSVAQDELVNGTSDGDTSPDAVKGATSDTVQLRAERDGSGNGRVYRLHVSGDDSRGGTCEKTVIVGVPHDKGKGATVIDSGDTFDSFGS